MQQFDMIQQEKKYLYILLINIQMNDIKAKAKVQISWLMSFCKGMFLLSWIIVIVYKFSFTLNDWDMTKKYFSLKIFAELN